MKKVFLLSLSVLMVFSALNVNRTEAFTPNMEGTWYCQNGLPVAAISWGDYSNQGYTVSKYYVRRNGVVVKTLFPPTQEYVDTNVDYNTNYHYIIEADATPTNFAAVDGGDITTGSCMYVSSVSGPSSVNTGDSVSVSGTFIWGSNSAATYTLGIYTSGGSAIDTYGGAGLSSSPQTITSPSGQITAPATAGTYQICAKGDIPGAGLSDSRCSPIEVTAPPASMVHTFTDGTTSKIIDVNGSVSTLGSGTNVTSCSKSVTVPSGKPSVVYGGSYPATGGNVSVPAASVSGFTEPTTGTPYSLNLICYSNNTFSSLDKTSNLARTLAPFLGFVKVAYAATSKTISLPVNVNALPNAVLNVNSVGVSGMSVIGVSGAPSGTTNYTSSSGSTISGTLAVPQTAPNGATFTGWSGCDGVTLYSCHVVVNPGETQTVIVYFSTPVPSQPNLSISAGISVSPSSPVAGDKVTFSATVRNSGDGSAGANSTTQLKIDLYDNGGGSIWDQTSNKTTGNLASGGSENENWNNVWTAVVGTHRIRVCADNGGVISESNESDNCTDTYVTVEEEGEEELPPPPESGFDYSLSNSGTSSATKGSVDVYTQNTITKTLTSGSSQSVNLSVSGVPSGVTTSFSNKTCSPTCNSTITFTVSPSAPTGNHNITITGSSPTRTTNFTLAITGSAMSIDCVPSPATAMIGQPVTWTANVTGGTAPYTYSWSGSGIPTNPAPDVNPYSVTYSTTGQKNATVQVTDDNSQTASCPANSSAQINFNPQFEEF